MNQSLGNRAAAIRQYLGTIDPPLDPALTYTYSVTAARFERMRLLIDRGRATPTDDARYHELTQVLRTLTERLSLPLVCAVHGDDAIPGVTDSLGRLPRDACRFLHDSWRDIAEVWNVDLATV